MSQIANVYPEAQIDDLRIKPSHGYRAVHVIVKVAGFPVEIQVRTPLQNSWAQGTESLADSFDPEIKYGGGPEQLRHVLELVSTRIAGVEDNETSLITLRASVSGEVLQEEFSNLETELLKQKKKLHEVLQQIMMAAEKKV